MKVEERYKYFEELKTTYKHEEKPFQEFLTYFKKHWMELDFIDLGDNRERITRTNNYCEGFHSHLSKIFDYLIIISLEQLISHPHPIPSVLLEVLKEYEYTIRQEVISSFSCGNSQRTIEEPLYLPFQKLLLHNEKIQSQIREKRISLTEISTNEDFLKNSEELLLSLESLFFFTKIPDEKNEVLIYLFLL